MSEGLGFLHGALHAAERRRSSFLYTVRKLHAKESPLNVSVGRPHAVRDRNHARRYLSFGKGSVSNDKARKLPAFIVNADARLSDGSMSKD
jgi:hypothetical protein